MAEVAKTNPVSDSHLRFGEGPQTDSQESAEVAGRVAEESLSDVRTHALRGGQELGPKPHVVLRLPTGPHKPYDFHAERIGHLPRNEILVAFDAHSAHICIDRSSLTRS